MPETTTPTVTLLAMLLEHQRDLDSRLLLMDQEIMGLQETLRQKFDLRVELQDIQSDLVTAVDAVVRNRQFIDRIQAAIPAEEGEAA